MGRLGFELAVALVAKKVLEDCRLAHEVMEVETDPDRLRVEWIGSLALLRLVGDVLNKVDSKQDAKLKASISAQFVMQKHEPIYAKFIKGARDRALHEYDHDLLDESEFPIVVESADGDIARHELSECLFMPLTGEFRAWEDARDVYLEAITWWDDHIAAILRRMD